MNKSNIEAGQAGTKDQQSTTAQNEQVSQPNSNTNVSGWCGQNESKKIIIECGCGSHLLQVQSEVEYFNDTINNMTRFNQEFYLAMYSYGAGSDKDKFWRRIKIGLKYLRTGKMFSDQIVLSQDEANKMSSFINENMVDACK